jgi:hypothetical protein
MPATLDDLTVLEIGGGSVRRQEIVVRLEIPAKRQGYADAQLDDHRNLPRRHFPWRPPLRLELRARASGPDLPGTLGFGFWNDPFSISLGQAGAARRLPAVPRALWFFYTSSRSDLALAGGVPGSGWKAVSLNPPQMPDLIAVPALASGAALSSLSVIRRPLMRLVQSVAGAEEEMLPVRLDEWHQYAIDWRPMSAKFSVDGKTVLQAGHLPTAALGFVGWIDNQFATASPERGLSFGIEATSQPQWLEIRDLILERL